MGISARMKRGEAAAFSPFGQDPELGGMLDPPIPRASRLPPAAIADRHGGMGGWIQRFFFCFCCPTRTFCSAASTTCTETWVADGQVPIRHLAAGDIQILHRSPSILPQPEHRSTMGILFTSD